MAKLAYYLLLIPVYLFSLLPLKFHYIMSDFTAWLLRVVFRYRYAVAVINISRSFPDMKYDQIMRTVKQFYKGFTDVFYEMIWSCRISARREHERLILENPGILENLYKRGESVIVVMGHKANWELLKAIDFSTLGFKTGNARVIYKKQRSPVADSLLKWIRLRHTDALVIESNETARYMLNNRNNQLIYFLIADQSPHPRSKCVTDFLNQPTMLITGPENLSRKMNMPVVYLDIKRLYRGKYQARFTYISDTPASTEEGEISRKFAELLEKSISENPSEWLWTHKRWKKKVSIYSSKKVKQNEQVF
jgi:KDO2-lipid IV(A) lauroyltransferase